jgi:hypothetical protein
MFNKTTITSTIAIALLGATVATLPVQAEPSDKVPTLAAKVKASVAAIEAVKNFLSPFKPSVVLEVDNETDLKLTRKWDSHSWGGYVVPPKKFVAPKSASVFGSQGKGIAGVGITGTEGSVTYEVGNLDLDLHVEWNNPTFGSNSCNAYLTGGAASKYRAECLQGAGFQAHTTFVIYKFTD